LILRDLHEDDAPLIWRMAHEDAIRRYQEVLRLESKDAIVEFIRTAIIHNNQQPRQGFNLVIMERQRKQSIGWIGWGHSEDSTYGDYSVGYALLPQYWGIGYMTEALRSALGVPGEFCTSGNETNWYGRSPRWDAEKSIRLSRS
jgi:RimJ/RimL family protein N-acetyltransferase